MGTIIITRGDDGKIDGLGEKDKLAYARFGKRLKELATGDCMTISTWFDRNPKLHGLHFSILTSAFDAQEQFSTLEGFRHWVACGAGHCVYAPGPQGKMVAIPLSVSWTALDDSEFADYHKRAIAFLQSERATSFLWPHLSAEDQSEMIEGILSAHEKSGD